MDLRLLRKRHFFGVLGDWLPGKGKLINFETHLGEAQQHHKRIHSVSKTNQKRTKKLVNWN